MTPRLSALVAVAQNRVIGKDNAMPWRLPPDLKRFKMLTMGHPIIMGRCIIITSQTGYEAQDTIVVHTIAEALRACHDDKGNEDKPVTTSDAESFVIGGAEIFQQMLPLCDRLYITEIQRDYDGDVLFPEFNHEEWKETSREKHHWGDSGLEYHFVVFDRQKGKGAYPGGYTG